MKLWIRVHPDGTIEKWGGEDNRTLLGMDRKEQGQPPPGEDIIEAAESAFTYMTLVYNGSYWKVSAENINHSIGASGDRIIPVLEAVVKTLKATEFGMGEVR